MLTLLREALFFSRYHLRPLLLIALIYTLPSTLVELGRLGSEEALSRNVQLLVSALFICLGVIQFGAAMIYIDRRVHNQPIDVGGAIRQAIGRLLPLLLVNLLMGIAVGGGLMLLILPGLFLAYKLLFAEFLLLFHQRSPLDALKESYRVTEGQFNNIVPPLAVWVALVILLSTLRLMIFGQEGGADAAGLLLQEGLSMLLSVFGWALLYRLYQRFIADLIDPLPPTTRGNDDGDSPPEP